jgi:epoxyqueuosine reductase
VRAPTSSLTKGAVAAGREAGLDAVGVAPARPFTRARAALEGARSIVVGARSYGGGSRRTAGARPTATVARYAQRDHYRLLAEGLEAVATHLKDAGWKARVIADDNSLVDREAAYRAGLGWYGKSANILLPERGSWFVLGSVVTNAPLTPSRGPVEDGCGSCHRCIESCPTGAIVEPGVVDARRCLAWLLQAPGVFPVEARAALGDRLYGCDECQEVCPPNLVVDRRASAGVAAGDVEADRGVDLIDLLAATDDELLARHGRWYIPDRDLRYVRRNALVVLGNVGDGRDPEVEATLRRFLTDPDELLRAHACWACVQLGRADLLALVDGDESALVLAEL